MPLRLTLSSSSLSTYSLCKRKFFIEYLLRQESDEENIFGILGSSVHRTAKDLVEIFFPSPNVQETITKMRDYATTNWKNTFAETFTDIDQQRRPEASKSQYEWILNQGYPILNNMITMINDEGLVENEPQLLEHKFLIDLLGNDSLKLSGIVDLLLLRENDLLVVDWKTQHKLPEIDENVNEGDFQLEIYSLFALKYAKEKGIKFSGKVRAERWYLRHKTIHSYEMRKDDISSAMRSLMEAYKGIIGGDFKPTKGEGCKYCPILWKECKTIPYF